MPEVTCGGERPARFVHFPGGCLLAPTMSGGKGRDLLIVIFFVSDPNHRKSMEKLSSLYYHGGNKGKEEEEEG